LILNGSKARDTNYNQKASSGRTMKKAFDVNKNEKLESVTIWLDSYSDIDDLYDILKAQLRKYGSFCITFNFYEEDLKCKDGNKD